MTLRPYESSLIDRDALLLSQASDDWEEGAKALKAMEEKIDTDKMGKPSFSMVLTGLGGYACRRPDGIYVVPVGCFKN